MKNLLICLLLSLFFCVNACKYFGGSGKEMNDALLKAREDSIMIADSIREVRMLLEKSAGMKQDSAQNAGQSVPSDKSRFRYKIVVGSFKSAAYAENLAGTYTLKGFRAKVILMEGTAFRLVVVEEYADLATAQAKLSEFTRNVFPNAWLYVTK